uniref:NADH-ubiquinone oxidoreductase chain 2 n=1 Tax=Leptogaster longicauda TaxID=1812705 RepID=A0A161G6H6_9MUSC|nr:NADH dehydrogenase subunit 2 [Leptogaster longicauda]
MLKTPAKILFIIMMMIGTFMAISSNSWVSAWMGLEINLLAFIPLMTTINNLMSSEAALKYFLTQTLASLMFLFASIFLFLKPLDQVNTLILFKMMILCTLLIKSGTAPFHFWFPMVMEGLSWMCGLILLTWQKIAPLVLISYLPFNKIFYIISIISIFIGSIGGLNQTSLKKIMAFSSINHLGWMLTALSVNENLWFMYFTVYSLLSLTLVMFFNMFKIFYMNQVFSLFVNSKIFKFIFCMNFLSLGGLPPFTGFFPKWMVIQHLIHSNQIMLMFLMTTLTLVTLYYYIRICYSAFMFNHNENNWNTLMKINSTNLFILMIMTFFSSFSLFILSLVYFML